MCILGDEVWRESYYMKVNMNRTVEAIGGGDFSITAWVKVPRLREQDYIILLRAGGGLSDFKLYIQKHTGLLRLSSFNVGDYGCGVIDNGSWNHIAVTYQDYALRFYRNGLLLYTFQVSGGVLPAPADSQIALPAEGDGSFPGEIDQLRVLARYLSADEVVCAMNANAHPHVVASGSSRIPPAPLYEDPLFNSAKDGTVVWNRYEQNWWYFYMQVRNGANEPGVSRSHGTTIGVSVSEDGGLTWEYRGFLRGLDAIPGSNTHWAPDIVWEGGKYHAFITKVRGKTNPNWEGDRFIFHYTSTNMMDWTREGKLEQLSSSRCLDGTAYKLPDGKWGFWYKDEVANRTAFAEGADLLSLRFQHFIDLSAGPLEGPNVFFWKDYYWLIGDDLYSYEGIRVYRSTDCRNWERKSNILHMSGSRRDDAEVGHHPEVIVNGEETCIFYWVSAPKDPAAQFGRNSYLQVAKLEFKDGELACDRDKEFELLLPCPPIPVAGHEQGTL